MQSRGLQYMDLLRTRSEVIRTIKTLGQLTVALRTEGFNLQHSVYLRLIPRNQSTYEGKQHVKTTQQDSQRLQLELAGLLGPEEVSFVSQDDKSKVPIGLTAANKHAPLHIHLDYLVTLPDHDYVIAPQHKLISVIGAMEIKKN